MVEAWWRAMLQDKSKLAHYATYMDADTLDGLSGSFQKSWHKAVFGKEWFYRRFLAFGKLDTHT